MSRGPRTCFSRTCQSPPKGSDVSDEVKDAQDGKAAPSAPKKVDPTPPKKVDPSPVVKSLPPSAGSPTAPKDEPMTPAPVVPSVPAAPPLINSSTHRASHARLVRKMSSLGEMEAPNMTRLFNGTRKDWCLIQKNELLHQNIE